MGKEKFTIKWLVFNLFLYLSYGKKPLAINKKMISAEIKKGPKTLARLYKREGMDDGMHVTRSPGEVGFQLRRGEDETIVGINPIVAGSKGYGVSDGVNMVTVSRHGRDVMALVGEGVSGEIVIGDRVQRASLFFKGGEGTNVKISPPNLKRGHEITILLADNE